MKLNESVGATLIAPPGDSQTLFAFGSMKAMQINASWTILRQMGPGQLGTKTNGSRANGGGVR